MIVLYNSTIDKSCKMVRIYFPYTLILDVFKDITGDQNLSEFPDIRKFEENIMRSRKTDTKFSLNAIRELSLYFYEEQKKFLEFLRSLTSQSILNEVVNKISLDDFISKVNILLYKDSSIRIDDYKSIQKWVPNKAEKDIFLNIEVPEYIQDYFIEALDCFAFDLFRSCIIFCTFALEASLRYVYAEMVNDNNAYIIGFNNLINWGIKNNFLSQNDFNKASIEFIRKYRNDLAHCNMNKPNAKSIISRNYAKRMASIIIHLNELFINNIFY